MLRLRIRNYMESRLRGIGVVEQILILVVLIGLVIIFRNQLTTIVNTIFTKISTQSSGI